MILVDWPCAIGVGIPSFQIALYLPVSGAFPFWVGNNWFCSGNYLDGDSAQNDLPHCGVRPFHRESTGLPELILGPCVVQIWSRNVRKSKRTKAPNSTQVGDLMI